MKDAGCNRRAAAAAVDAAPAPAPESKIALRNRILSSSSAVSTRGTRGSVQETVQGLTWGGPSCVRSHPCENYYNLEEEVDLHQTAMGRSMCHAMPGEPGINGGPPPGLEFRVSGNSSRALRSRCQVIYGVAVPNDAPGTVSLAPQQTG